MTEGKQHSFRLPIELPEKYKDPQKVKEDFWPKFKRVASKVPGVADVLALFFYLNSDRAPASHKLSIVATLAYFIMPMDVVPDFLGPIIGYSDDLALALGLIRFIGTDEMKPYRVYARRWLKRDAPATKPTEADIRAAEHTTTGEIIDLDPSDVQRQFS